MRHYIVESVRRKAGCFLKFLPVKHWESTHTNEEEARRKVAALERLQDVTVLRLSAWDNEGDCTLSTGHYAVRFAAVGANEEVLTQMARPHGHDLVSGRWAVGEWRESLGQMMAIDQAMLLPLEVLTAP